MSSIKRSIESEFSDQNKRIKTEVKSIGQSEENVLKVVDKDSMERMDNELIRDIFYYLPLEDKFRLITLNKRMKTCLAESQLDLTIDNKIGNQYNSWSPLEMSDTPLEEDIEDEEETEEEELDYFLKANTSALNFILKTFPAIETMDLCNSSLDNKTVAIICDNNCPKLKVLKFTDFGINDKSIITLGETYGQRLTKLIIQSSFCGHKLGFDKILLSFCQNLVEIHCESIETFVEENDKFLPKLQNITTFIRKSQDFDSLKQVVLKYKNQLKALTLFIHLEEGIDVCKDFDVISDLVVLESINFDFFDWFYEFEKINKSLEKIAINCKQIDSFRIGFNFCCYPLISLDLFKTFGHFSNLKRFSAQLLITDKEKQEITEQNGNQLIEELRTADIRCWEGCKRLTHLDLCFSEMTDKFVENIDLFLPNLISIHLSSGKELTDCTLNSFINLKHLKALKLSKNRFKRETFPQITDSGIEKLFTSTSSLKSLTFLGQPNITQKTIDLFIELAEKHPNKGFRFQCYYKDFDENCIQFIKDVDIESLEKPNNLWLNIQRFDFSDDEFFVTDESEDNEDYSEIDSEEEIDSELDFEPNEA